MDCKRLEIELVKGSTYAVEETKGDKYEVCYCVRYRPVGAIEWILLRGQWNDRGVWTADGIFNDGII